MTAETRLERNLPGILDDLSAGPAPDYFDDVFVRTARMRQRPGWTFPGRWLPMADITRSRAFAPAPPWRLIAVALVLIALVLAALFAFAGSQRRVAPPFGPARNGEIVYESAGDLYVGNPDTGESRLLVGSPDAESSPGYSLDGTRVAFYREPTCCPGTVEIWTVKADGSDLHQVTTTEPVTKDNWANWAPDSRHLAVITVAGGPGRLELLDADNVEPPRTLATDVDIDSVTFRPPDGDAIAFRAIVDGKYGVYAIDFDGTNKRTILEPTVPLETDNHAANMAYSPDGERLFYQGHVVASNGSGDGCCQLWVVNADGTDPHRFESVNPAAWTGVPSVSPDGRWVSYWSVLRNTGDLQIRVAPADESGPSIATGPKMNDFSPWAWSPDSSKILMFPGDGSSSSAYLIDPEGGPYETIPWESGSGIDWQRLAP
jgi:Tol biopolymer transport system component